MIVEARLYVDDLEPVCLQFPRYHVSEQKRDETGRHGGGLLGNEPLSSSNESLEEFGFGVDHFVLRMIHEYS
jgi:hypothetical protein